MTTTHTTMVPCVRFDAETGGDAYERNTLIAVEYGDEGMVDVHLSPQMEDVQTFSFTTEDGWRFLRELAKALTEAEGK